MDEQAAHSANTGQTIYGRNSKEVLQTTAARELGFWTVSILWQQLIGTSLTVNVGIGRQLTVPSSSSSSTTTTPTTTTTAASPALAATPTSPNLAQTLTLQGLLRKVQGDDARFKADHQLLATHHMLTTRADLLYIAPTGSGKTWVYLTAAQAMPGKTVVVVIPLMALRADLNLRVRRLSFNILTWNGQQPDHDPTLLMVSAEAVGSPSFLEYLSRLHVRKQLAWVVLDEVHLLLTEASYRPAMGHVLALRSLPFPLLLLSASLPPVLEERLKAELSSKFSTLRVSCDRPRLRYQVHLVATLQEVLTETFEAMIKADTHLDYLEEEKHQPGGRVIVFVSRKADADGLIRVINGQMAYRVHHSDLSVTEKEEALAAWRDGTVKFMIATKGFGVGVDYPHVRFVLHLGGSSSVLDYAQETGRAGRDGEEANAQLITFPHFGRLLGQLHHPLAPLLSGNCLRQEISRDVDRDMVAPCALGDQVTHCNNCREGNSLVFGSINLTHLLNTSHLFAPQH